VALALVALAGFAAAWRWTPLGDSLALGSLVDIARSFDKSPVAPLAVLAAYVLAGVLVIPVTALIVATGIVFGPLLGAIYALCGALASASVMYWIGRRIGRNTVRRLAGPRLNRITRRLAKKGLIAMIIVRMVPIAPFSVVNAVAGASRLRLRHFLLGTAVGMFPGIVATVVFVDRVAAVITDPGVGTFLMLAAVIGLLLAMALFIHRRLSRAETVPARVGGD
jgi:uncharacterized membrane protein YdjX (TVP38/TMEM64 family)